MIKISVILIAYNAQETVRDALASVLSQDYHDLELICVDDHSDDTTEKIFRETARKDKRVKVIRNKENRGILYARHAGLEAADGEYVMFLDSDDTLKQGALSHLNKILEGSDTDVCEFATDVVFSPDCELSDEQKAHYLDLFRFKKKDRSRSSKELLLSCFRDGIIPVNAWTRIYQKDLLKQALRHYAGERVVMEEDWLITFMVLAECKKYQRTAEKCHEYHIGEGASIRQSITDKKQAIQRADAIAVPYILDKWSNAESFDQDTVKETTEIIRKKIWQIVIRDLCNNCDYSLSEVFFKEMMQHCDFNEFLLYFTNAAYSSLMKDPADAVNRLRNYTLPNAEAGQYLDNLLSSLNEQHPKDQKNLSRVDINTIRNIFLNSTTWKIGSIFTYLPRRLKEYYLKKKADESTIARNIFVPSYDIKQLFDFRAFIRIWRDTGALISDEKKLLEMQYSGKGKLLVFADEIDEIVMQCREYCSSRNLDMAVILFDKGNENGNSKKYRFPVIVFDAYLQPELFTDMDLFDGVVVHSSKSRDIAYYLKDVPRNALFVSSLKIRQQNVRCVKEEDFSLAEESDWLFYGNLIQKKGKVSVIIPTFNAEKGLEKLLTLLEGQKHISPLEIILVDSGSEDDTLKIAQRHGVKTVSIDHNGFSHSKARNLGSKHASGKYLLFTVQDALPYSPLTVCRLLQKIYVQNAAAVSPYQQMGKDCDIYYDSIMAEYKRAFALSDCGEIRRMPLSRTYYNIRMNSCLDNVMCLVKKDIFDRFGFRFAYGEDCDLGVRLIDAGHTIVKTRDTGVIHSHDRPSSYYLRRNITDVLSMSRIYPDLSLEACDQDTAICRCLTYYAFYVLCSKSMRDGEYRQKDYSQRIISFTDIAVKMTGTLKKIPITEYRKLIESNRSDDRKLHGVVLDLMKHLDRIQPSLNELEAIGEHVIDRMGHAIYLSSDRKGTSGWNEDLILFLEKEIAAQIGQTLGSYLMLNRGKDEELDEYIQKLNEGI